MTQDKLFDRYAPSLTAETPHNDGSAVLRVILPNMTPCFHAFLEVSPWREFRVIELLDGRLFDEYLDNGERKVSRFTKEEITDGLSKGRFREERNGA